MICAGSNENNIVSILVHESIHHALLWMSDEAYNLTDPLDEVVPFLNSKGVMEDGFSFDG